jgi:hypothetical protein
MNRCTRTSPSPNNNATSFLAPAQPLSNPAGAEPFDPFMNFNFKRHRAEDDPLEEADEGWQCEAFPTR